MKQQLEALLDIAFKQPGAVLGTVERNTEIKVVYLMLWALGWDPVLDIACGFHLPRDKVKGDAKAANAIDFALRDNGGLCAFGEVKQWHVGSKQWDEGLAQIRRYQRAILVPRAFLSCGKRWLILDERSEVLADVNADDPRRLLEQLRTLLSKGAIQSSAFSGAWEYGICPSGKFG